MQNGKASKTAQYMAFFRALESQQPSARRLFNDPYAEALLSGSLGALAQLSRYPLLRRAVRGVLDWGWPCTRSSGVVRTRAIDDWVVQAVAEGAQQLVLLGAGFDSRGLRLPQAKEIPVFEVDHPATQEEKRKRLQSCIERVPANIHYVAVDFERDDLETQLRKAGFAPQTPAVVVWEGVISYLTEPAVQSTFHMLSRLLAPSSSVIFTYMHKAALDGSRAFPGARRWRSWVRWGGEPFLSGFDPATLGEVLKPFRFQLVRDTSTEQIAREYCPPLGRHEPGSAAYRVAVAAREER